MLILGLTVAIASCAVFSFAYLYFLGLRIIRTGFDNKQSAFFMGLIVCSGILAATVSLEAVLLIGVAREVSGRLFFVVSILGIIVFALSSAGVLGHDNPVKAALAQRIVAIGGLMIGNPLLLGINALCFSKALPSVL